MGGLTVTVENFGKIKYAKVELSPLTLFIGDNNSGKSYLMSLIYGLVNTHIYEYAKDFDNKNQYVINCENWISCFINEGKKKRLDLDFIHDIFGLCNHLINHNKDIFMKLIFNHTVSLGKIQFSLGDMSNYDFNIDVGIKTNNTITFFLDGNEFYDFSYDFFEEKKRIASLIEFIQVPYVICITSLLVNSLDYLPTSRTGFMLSYKLLNQKTNTLALSLNNDDNKLNTKFTIPIIDFLNNLTVIDIEKINGEFKEIIDFMEQKMMCGKIVSRQSQIADHYFSFGDTEPVPLHIVSSVVTELTPLLLLLKHYVVNEGLMIEEPEMCLHPQLQWHMARVLIMLSKKLEILIVSTHSDIIIQHINNMHMLSQHSNKETLAEKYGYSESDIIDIKNVKVYQFDIGEDGYTEVTEIKPGKLGFATPTFNITLDDMFKQTMEFEGINEDA